MSEIEDMARAAHDALPDVVVWLKELADRMDTLERYLERAEARHVRHAREQIEGFFKKYHGRDPVGNELEFELEAWRTAQATMATIEARVMRTIDPPAEEGTNTTQLATTAFVQTAIDNAIYDLPVTRSGLVSAGTDVVLFETGVLDPAWYDQTHVLNVSFFARNTSGVTSNTTFKLQLYDEGTSTAHTIGSIYADTLEFDLLQASIYRTSSSGLNCNIQYHGVSKSGYVTLASGSYKLRVVCISTLDTRFRAAQVRFTK